MNKLTIKDLIDKIDSMRETVAFGGKRFAEGSTPKFEECLNIITQADAMYMEALMYFKEERIASSEITDDLDTLSIEIGNLASYIADLKVSIVDCEF